MVYKLILPKFGMAMESAKIIEWMKELGDPVQREEAVLVVENEKLSSEIVSMETGVLLKKVAIIGEKYQVGDLLGYVGEPGEEVPEAEENQRQSEQPVQGEAVHQAEQVQETEAAQPAASGGGRVTASPLAKRMAADLGYDLHLIQGSGPGGRVEKADVERYTQEASQQIASSAAQTQGDSAPQTQSGRNGDMPLFSEGEYSDAPLSSMRQAIGQNMHKAWTDIPMVTHQVKADVSDLLSLREAMNQDIEEGSERVSVNDLLLKISAVALRKMPTINAALLGDTIRTYSAVHLGLAVALEQGLIVPVIHHAHKKSLLQISKESKALVERARKGTLAYTDLEGATFTVTNLGSYGSVDEFTPIVNPPQAAILGIGRTVDTPVVVEGEICVRAMMSLSFTYDHRVIDGAVAAEFMKIMLELLANPLRALLTIE